MAHEIDQSNGKDNMAYVGELPWHGLGQKLTEDADIETWKKEAGMEWKVKSSPVKYSINDGSEEKIEQFSDRNVLFRSDTNAPLSVVSDNYKIVHPGDVLEFFRDLISEQGFKMETAGCLFGGRKFWALAKTGKEASIMGQDTIAPYLLMASSCDASMATCAHFTSVRVVCNNTLRMSIGHNGLKAQLKVPHSAMFDPSSIKHNLGLHKDIWGEFIENINTLANIKLNRDEAIQLLADQLKEEWINQDGDNMSSDEILNSSLAMRRIISLYDGEGIGSQFKSANGTAWGLVNAVTQYYDHEFGSRGEKSRAFERAHITDRASFKVKVASKLLSLAA